MWFQCWKSRVRDTDGEERFSRGCITVLEQIPLYCSVSSFSSRNGHKKRHTDGQYAIECCTGDFCNNGTFPELPKSVYKGEYQHCFMTMDRKSIFQECSVVMQFWLCRHVIISRAQIWTVSYLCAGQYVISWLQSSNILYVKKNLNKLIVVN